MYVIPCMTWYHLWASQVALKAKNLSANTGDSREEKWQLTPVLLPGESHGERSQGVTRIEHDPATNLPPYTRTQFCHLQQHAWT